MNTIFGKTFDIIDIKSNENGSILYVLDHLKGLFTFSINDTAIVKKQKLYIL